MFRTFVINSLYSARLNDSIHDHCMMMLAARSSANSYPRIGNPSDPRNGNDRRFLNMLHEHLHDTFFQNR